MELKKINNDSSQMFIKIKKFNINELYETRTILIIGNHVTKPLIIKEIIDVNKNKPILAINPTESHEPFYSKFSSNVSTEYSDELISNVLNEQQEKLYELQEKNKIDEVKQYEVEPYIVVLDNCIDNKVLKNNHINELIYNGIFYHITTILTSEYAQFSPEIRSNFDYVFLLACDEIRCKNLYDYYGNTRLFPSFNIFKKVFNKLTENNGIMVISNCRRGCHTDEVYWYQVNSIDQKIK